MTSMLERLTGAGDEEEAVMAFPPQGLPAVPGTSAIPWWTGVPGLDPDVRYTDRQYAAECAAIACGIFVLGADAGRADWLSGQMASPVKKWAEWLMTGGEFDAPKRMMTLRLLCERSGGIRHDQILNVAEKIRRAGTLR